MRQGQRSRAPSSGRSSRLVAGCMCQFSIDENCECQRARSTGRSRSHSRASRSHVEESSHDGSSWNNFGRDSSNRGGRAGAPLAATTVNTELRTAACANSCLGLDETFMSYLVEASRGNRSWAVKRRYSEFEIFHRKVGSSLSGTVARSSFPAKKWWGNLAPEFVQGRQDGLNNFLQHVCDLAAEHQGVHADLMRFLKPNHVVENARALRSIEDKFERGEQLGSGMTSIVWQARPRRKKRGAREVALKVIEKNRMSELSIVEEVKCEVAILRQVEHPNLCKLYNVFETPDELVLSLELLRGRPLLEAVISKQRYSEDDAKLCITQLLDAVQYLHSCGVCHRDIKPENCIFADDSLQVLKLTDFGLASLCAMMDMDEIVGTPMYMAPEILQGEQYTFVCDMWSLGVLMYVLLVGSTPFEGVNVDEIIDSVTRGEWRVPAWCPLSPEAKDLLCQLLQRDPALRISATEALNHPWFTPHTMASPILDDRVSASLAELERHLSGRTEKEKQDLHEEIRHSCAPTMNQQTERCSIHHTRVAHGLSPEQLGFGNLDLSLNASIMTLNFDRKAGADCFVEAAFDGQENRTWV